MTGLLIRGTSESAFVNAIIVFVKVAIVLIFIAVGWGFINPANHEPYVIPANMEGYEPFWNHGWPGVLTGAAIVFFAFIGFDAVSTAAQEAKNPQRDMPIGILGSLVICTILYILFSHVLTGVADFRDFNDSTKGKEASVAYAISTYMEGYGWLATAVTIAILAGFSSVILVMLMGQSRVFYTMSKDGLLPKMFSQLHPTFSTPYKSNLILFLFVGLFGGFIPGSVAGDLTSIGTLFAFVLVSGGVLLLPFRPKEAGKFQLPYINGKWIVPAFFLLFVFLGRTRIMDALSNMGTESYQEYLFLIFLVLAAIMTVYTFIRNFSLIPVSGVLCCMYLMIEIPTKSWMVFFGWMAIGLIIYFLYGYRKSRLANAARI
jgi:APA family basic amino acid/polyamine antiporter